MQGRNWKLAMLLGAMLGLMSTVPNVAVAQAQSDIERQRPQGLRDSEVERQQPQGLRDSEVERQQPQGLRDSNIERQQPQGLKDSK